MVFFRRLRLCMRERRFDQKLREIKVTPARSRANDLLQHRVAMRPLCQHHLSTETEKAAANATGIGKYNPRSQQPKGTLWTQVEVAFVQTFQGRRVWTEPNEWTRTLSNTQWRLPALLLHHVDPDIWIAAVVVALLAIVIGLVDLDLVSMGRGTI